MQVFIDKLFFYFLLCISLTGGTKIENDFFMMNQEALAYVRLYYYYCSGPTYSPISCVYGGSNVGFVFYESCHSDVFSVLCCGNGTHCHGQHVVTLS